MEEPVPLAALRRHVLAAQAFATRVRRAGPEDVAAAVRRLSCVQLDSISTVDRSHRIVLASRVGAFPKETVSALLGQGRLFEYWAHEASLVPIEDYPLFRERMRERRTHHWFGPVIDSSPKLAERILAEVREKGALPARAFGGAGHGGMWNWKPAKRMLDALWTAGDLVVAGREGFERLYDLPERVIPRRMLDAPAPEKGEALEALALRAVEGRGALTARGIVEHYRLQGDGPALRARLERLVAERRLRKLPVEDGGPPVYVPGDCDPGDAPRFAGSVLLSPFENLLWDRRFAERLFGFRHVMEIYKRPGERVFGYYVLPFLHGEKIVGRADAKSDREAGVLQIRALHLEPGVRFTGAVEDGFHRAAGRLARSIGLESAGPIPRPRPAKAPVTPRNISAGSPPARRAGSRARRAGSSR